jgi:hypothetical protein
MDQSPTSISMQVVPMAPKAIRKYRSRRLNINPRVCRRLCFDDITSAVNMRELERFMSSLEIGQSDLQQLCNALASMYMD